MKPKRPIYLDYAATTPVDESVADVMAGCLTFEGNFANPASRSHFYGWQAEAAVEKARGQVASLLNADPRSIVWTSGATESNNLAIKGFAQEHQHRGCHLVTSVIEHKAVIDAFRFLETQGFEVTYLAPNPQGVIAAWQVEQALRDDTLLVALMHVNNELGSINPIAEIAEVCRAQGVFFHVDAAQSIGKVAVDVKALGAHTMALSAHKFYGPKGVGVLYVQREPQVTLQAQIHGGGHQRGMRSGTLPTHQIAGLGAAAEVVKTRLENDLEHVQQLRVAFLQKLSVLSGAKRNGDEHTCVDSIVNISFTGVDGETLLTALRDLAVSTGSACMSATVEPSYVLQAIGISNELAHASIRFSFGRYTTLEDVNAAAEKVIDVVSLLRARR